MISVFDLPALIQSFGYIGIAAILFAESGLFFGFFLPGDSLLFTAGFLAFQGHLAIVPLVVVSVAAAISGDSVGYWFGKKIGPRIFTREDSFWFSHARVESARAFFEKNGANSIILARFIPAVRTLTPIIAGVAGMEYRRFLSYNVIGGILWAVGLPLAGYYLGATVPGVDRYIIPIVLVGSAVSFIPVIVELVRRKKKG